MFVLSPTRQIPQDHPGSRMFAGIQGPNVAPPPQIGAILGKQEIPERLASAFSSGVSPSPAVVLMNGVFVDAEQPPLIPPVLTAQSISVVTLSSVSRRVLIQQEQPYHPLPRLLSSWKTTNVATRPQIEDSLIVTQEQPFHPLPKLLASTPSVLSPVLRGLIIRQEQPYHPDSRLLSSWKTTNVAPPPQIGTVVFGKVEIPSYIQLALVFGVQGPDVALIGPPLIATQEQPNHPYSKLVSNTTFAPPVTLPPFPARIITTQEQPYHPSSQLLKAIIAGNVAAPPQVASQINVKMEIPFHPASRFSSGTPPTVVTLTSTLRSIITKQEQPYHPLPSVSSGVFPASVSQASFSAIRGREIEIPPHPRIRLAQGIQGTVAAQLPVSTIITQQQPVQPASVLASSANFVAPAVIPPLLTPLLTLPQTLPYHPYPFLSSNSPTANQVEFNGLFWGAEEPPQVASVLSSPPLLGLPPVVLSAEYRTIITTQQLPDHPQPKLRIGIQGPNVAPLPQVGSIFVKQEQPFHPLPRFNLAIIPGNVAALPQVGRFITVQELPFHPSSQLASSVLPPPPPVPPVGKTIGSQEQPYHPGPQSWSYPPTSVPFFGIGTQLVTVQEYPFHPPSMLFFTGYGPEFESPGPNFARLLFNTKIRVRTLVNKTPRTIRYS